MHNLFLVYFVNIYMFRAHIGPSLGGTTVCIQQLLLTVLFRWRSIVLVGLIQSNQDNRQYDTFHVFYTTHNSIYNRLPEFELPGSKPVEDRKIKD